MWEQEQAAPRRKPRRFNGFINRKKVFKRTEWHTPQKSRTFFTVKAYSNAMQHRVLSIAALLLAASAVTAEAHDPTYRGCRAFYERSPGHIRVYRTDCPYAIQLPRRYAISPAQNFDAWRLDTSPGGIRRYSTGCGGDTFWDGSACVLWPAAVRNGANK